MAFTHAKLNVSRIQVLVDRLIGTGDHCPSQRQHAFVPRSLGERERVLIDFLIEHTLGQAVVVPKIDK